MEIYLLTGVLDGTGVLIGAGVVVVSVVSFGVILVVFLPLPTLAATNDLLHTLQCISYDRGRHTMTQKSSHTP